MALKVRWVILSKLLLIVGLIILPFQAKAEMYEYLDKKGICHYRVFPDNSVKIKIVAKDLDTLRNRAASQDPQTAFDELIRKAAIKSLIDPLLVKAVIKVESNYDPNAVSSKGAQGLMQIMPNTARDLDLSEPFNPEQNITAGTKYLKQQLDNYKNVKLGLVAYNAGPSRVSLRGMLIYIPGIQEYVTKVLFEYQRLIKNKKGKSGKTNNAKI